MDKISREMLTPMAERGVIASQQKQKDMLDTGIMQEIKAASSKLRELVIDKKSINERDGGLGQTAFEFSKYVAQQGDTLDANWTSKIAAYFEKFAKDRNIAYELPNVLAVLFIKEEENSKSQTRH